MLSSWMIFINFIVHPKNKSKVLISSKPITGRFKNVTVMTLAAEFQNAINKEKKLQETLKVT